MARCRLAWLCRCIAMLLVVHASGAHTFHMQQRNTYSNLQCRVNDPLSCSSGRQEVCVFLNGQYRCECPNGVSRLADGRCLMVNECARPSLNACHRDADCIDLPEGYTCRCKSGYSDVSQDKNNKPGRICQRTQNECGSKTTYGVDCDEYAACVDTADGYTCRCQPGYTDISNQVSKLPGRKCVAAVNECAMGIADCSKDADCFDRPDGYECRCRTGFVDASPNVAKYPGRVCNRPKTPEYYGQVSRQPGCQDNSNCGPNEECRFNTQGQRVCQCRRGSVQQSNGVCKVFSNCEQRNECDKNAFCSNTYDGSKCVCKNGFQDVSPDPLRNPGRKCVQLRNECADGTADCSPYADCEDTPTSYICKCRHDYIDVSSRYRMQPGRRCSKEAKQCSDPSLNNCDANADCVQLPDGYTCKCSSGFIDQSNQAGMPPGRVCTLSTACPNQPTDLVFLIDGSGSIGSYIFQTEVLRFLSEFIELFDIGPSKTQVSVVQYSDQIRHEFGLSENRDRNALQNAIKSIQYLTGLTRTGAAIEQVANEAFSERRGARPQNGGVSRVAIVITDGRSQDNVTRAANNARLQNVQLFAVGVTNHVLDVELEEISGSKERTFHVNGFEDLNTRLRSAIQKVACPDNTYQERPSNQGPCDPRNHNGCDRSRNQICVFKDGRYQCVCPPNFDPHPVTHVCGGDICNPEISTSCPDPEICEKTPFGNWRCICPADLGWRDKVTGVCKIGERPPEISDAHDVCDVNNPNSCGPNARCERGPGGELVCVCKGGFERNPKTDQCQAPGTCDPRIPDSCDLRKKEKCLPDGRGLFTCQCDRNHRRHPVTGICLMDECAAGQHDCHRFATCTDTDESYLCKCNTGYHDASPDQVNRPGRVCTKEENECLTGRHNCSTHADCFDLVEGFLCRCRDGYIDISPNPKQFGGVICQELINECLVPGANNCDKNATCHDTRDSYKCVCNEGFRDLDELRNPGRHCEKINTLCQPGRHDCDRNARCIERGNNDYDCVCNPGFLDKSPLPHKKGRKCLEQICSDDRKHNCHPAAICKEVDGPERYTCTCRDGYLDKNPGNPGRDCKPIVQECLDPRLNDCDPVATCVDLDDGYTCTCPPNSKDISPDPRNKPGRNCKPLINECAFPHLNNCSRFADCFDKEEGYTCKCKAEYHDQNPARPGTECKFIENECLIDTLNDCDKKHAKCIDTIEGYRCQCNAPYRDENPAEPGTVCRYNECLDPSTNDCDKVAAECIDNDSEIGYSCRCKVGYFDEATEPDKTGRICIKIQSDFTTVPPTTLDPNLIPCGGKFCHLDLGEVCYDGNRCDCRPHEARPSPGEKCVPVIEISLDTLAVEQDGSPITYSPSYSRPDTAEHVEIAEAFKKGIGSALQQVPEISPRYITTDVNLINNPKSVNPNWEGGVIINGTVKVAGDEPYDKCKLFKDYAEAVKSFGYRLNSLTIGKDFEQLDPCRPEAVVKGIPCGDGFCKEELGEICIAGKICGCKKGQQRNRENICKAVEPFNMLLYVIRDGSQRLEYAPHLSNPNNIQTKDLIDRFMDGIAESYDHTPLKSGFVNSEVQEIERPDRRNSSWVHGLLYNFTANFEPGTVGEPKTVWEDLVEYVMQRNNFEVGKSKLFVSPDQINVFGVCYNACPPNAICKEVHGRAICECQPGYRDLDPAHSGQKCLPTKDVNECEDPKLNECSPHARCIDLPDLYRCECQKPYKNSAEPPNIPGSSCELDYCNDVNYCPIHAKCHNTPDGPVCKCESGYKDLRISDKLAEAGLADAYCQLPQNVPVCKLGLHDCSSAAECIDLPGGKFKCKCPDNMIDGNLENPGHLCAAEVSDKCHNHGTYVAASNGTAAYCICEKGWHGDECESADSQAGLILMLILALLFLLLTLLCCLCLCARCRCFGARGSVGSQSGQEILGSDYYTIPRAKLAPRLDYQDDGALANYLDGSSLSSDGSIEEVERRVTTDVTTREIRTTTVRDESGNVISQSQMISHGAEAAGGMSGETETEQYGITSSDHFRTAASASASAAGAASSSAFRSASRSGAYDSDESEEDGGHQIWDRTTRTNQSHDFQPGPNHRSGVERSRNEFVTTTKSEEVNYF